VILQNAAIGSHMAILKQFSAIDCRTDVCTLRVFETGHGKEYFEVKQRK